MHAGRSAAWQTMRRSPRGPSLHAAICARALPSDSNATLLLLTVKRAVSSEFSEYHKPAADAGGRRKKKKRRKGRKGEEKEKRVTLYAYNGVIERYGFSRSVSHTQTGRAELGAQHGANSASVYVEYGTAYTGLSKLSD